MTAKACTALTSELTSSFVNGVHRSIIIIVVIIGIACTPFLRRLRACLVKKKERIYIYVYIYIYIYIRLGALSGVLGSGAKQCSGGPWVFQVSKNIQMSESELRSMRIEVHTNEIKEVIRMSERGIARMRSQAKRYPAYTVFCL